MKKWFEKKYIQSRPFQYLVKTLLIISIPFILSLCIAFVDWSNFQTLSFSNGEKSLIGFTCLVLVFSCYIQYKVLTLDYRISKKLEDRIFELERENKQCLRERDAIKEDRDLWLKISVHVNRILARKSTRILEAIKQGKKDLMSIVNPDLQIQENISQIKQFFDGLKISQEQKFRVTLMIPQEEDGVKYLKIINWDNEDLREPRSRLNNEYAKKFQKGRTVAGECWARGGIIIIEDCTKELKKETASRFEMIHDGHHGIKSMFSYPIFDRELQEADLIAVLNVDTNISGYFKEANLERINTIIQPFKERLIYEIRLSLLGM